MNIRTNSKYAFLYMLGLIFSLFSITSFAQTTPAFKVEFDFGPSVNSYSVSPLIFNNSGMLAFTSNGRGVLYDSSGLHYIDSFLHGPYKSTYVYDMNSTGNIVGQVTGVSLQGYGETAGFFFQREGYTNYNLNEITSGLGQGTSIIQAFDINDRNQILVEFRKFDFNDGHVLGRSYALLSPVVTSVPEPSTSFMLGIGFLCLVLFSFWKRRSAVK